MNRPVLNTLQGCAGLAVGDVPGAKVERLGRFGGIAGGAGVAGMKYRSRRAPSFRTATCCWALGLGSYKPAWAILHKLRRAMVRPGRDRRMGVVEVDETYWGSEEPGVSGRGAEEKALIIVAAQEDGKGIGRIRLRCIPDLSRASLHGFIAEAIEPGSTVRTDGLPAYLGLSGY